MNEKQNTDRKSHRATPSYDNPALCQILQGLSDLPYQEPLAILGASDVCNVQGGLPASISNDHESQGNTIYRLGQFAELANDAIVRVEDGAMPYNSSHSSITQNQAAVEGLDMRSYSSIPRNVPTAHQIPVKRSKVIIKPEQVYPTPSPESTHFDRSSFMVANRPVESSPKSLWSIPMSPIEAPNALAQPARQPEGLQDSRDVAGFDCVRHRRIGPKHQSSIEGTMFDYATAYDSPHSRSLDTFTGLQGQIDPFKPRAVVSTTHGYNSQSTTTQVHSNINAGHNQIVDGRQSEGFMGQAVTYRDRNGSLYGTASINRVGFMPGVTDQMHQYQPPAVLPSQMVHPKPFIPSTQALERAGMGFRDPARMPPGSKYRGDAFSWSYLKQIPNLPDHLNTSLWLKGLPPNIQPSQLFDMIHCGAVWSLDLKPTTNEHATVAATLTFKTAYAASAFWKHCRFQGLELDGYWISASYNKFGVPESASTESRVLQVEGPEHLMTPDGWEVQFKKACRFQIDRWCYLACPFPGRVRMEFRFVRIDGQAQSCRQMIERELGYLGITVCYGVDPCGELGYLA